MTKTLTAMKNKNLLKEFNKLLNQKSDDTLLNEIIMDRISKTLDQAINGSLLEKDESDEIKTNEHIRQFQPHHENIRRQAEKGVFVLQKQHSQRMDSKRGKG